MGEQTENYIHYHPHIVCKRSLHDIGSMSRLVHDLEVLNDYKLSPRVSTDTPG